jgi:CDP-paratose 2-epimerase
MGGGRNSSCSVLEAIIKTEKIARKSFDYKIIDQNRSGDHMWWVSDVRKFKSDYPSWDTSYNIDSILEELIFSNPKRDGN